jgi:hypothetical protein
MLVDLTHAQDKAPTTPPGEPRCFKGTRLDPDDPIQPRLASTVLTYGCSGSLVTFEGRTALQKALVLTAGHCIGIGSAKYGNSRIPLPGAGEVFKNLKQEGTFTIITPRPERRKECIGVSTLLYATLTDIDIALYELTETYQELEKRTGAVPFPVSRDPVVATAGPLRAPSGLHENEQVCTFGGDVQHAKEFVWTWGPLMRLEGCRFAPGHSGAPLISTVTGQLVGILATVNDGDGAPCEKNPCEVDASGRVTVRPVGTPYGHYAYRLAACMTAGGSLDLNLPACMLPK